MDSGQRWRRGDCHRNGIGVKHFGSNFRNSIWNDVPDCPEPDSLRVGLHFRIHNVGYLQRHQQLSGCNKRDDHPYQEINSADVSINLSVRRRLEGFWRSFIVYGVDRRRRIVGLRLAIRWAVGHQINASISLPDPVKVFIAAFNLRCRRISPTMSVHASSPSPARPSMERRTVGFPAGV